jgi:hypothetical protein
MKIICEKGFYKFYPDTVVELRRFIEKYGVYLVQCEDFFTFEPLASLPKFSIAGQFYSGFSFSNKTFAGKREEVMWANNYTYNQMTRSLTLSALLTINKMNYSFSNNIVMDKLPQAYFRENFGIITGFFGWVNVDYMKYNIERFNYL